ncbi:MAG: glycosyltransferase family 2 protein, partial [Cytophagaceae bacterium]|nr:glycosyltransferase family 2 protein [Cytophagaceae bacterium]
EKAKEIDQIKGEGLRYSVGTLVNNFEEYQVMLSSFDKAGFKDTFCEFIYIDNTKGNKYEAYEALNKIISRARGEYIILCHQDIELKFDTIEVLEKRIKELDQLDSNWGVISNAGGLHLKKIFQRISHLHEELNYGPFPYKVNSVDENFILIKKSANLSFSRNLKGYHMYGTDLCIIANTIGYNAWVIDFHLLHKSTGNMNNSFFQNRNELIAKYGKAFRPRYIRSTCTKVYISGSPLKRKIMNTQAMVFFSKLVLKVRRRIKGDYLFK